MSRPTPLSVVVTFDEEHRSYRTPLVFLRLRERETDGLRLREREADGASERREPDRRQAVGSSHGGPDHKAYPEADRIEQEVKGDDHTNGSPGFRLGIVSGRTRLRLAALALTTALRGLDVASRRRQLKSFFVDGCTIEVPAAETFVAVDGETIPLSPPLTYLVERRALQVVVS